MTVSGNATGIFLGMYFLSNSFGKWLAVLLGNFSVFCHTPMVSPGTLGLGLANQDPLKSHDIFTLDVEAFPLMLRTCAVSSTSTSPGTTEPMSFNTEPIAEVTNTPSPS
ncbi:unnamed protein product [Meganyctiphanes norvegica]|uniref:Uncharacterized protein n=1 Tax=Meganyctiphanes norvegica TaxID=48144 RepID=A0AAV2SL57_MEGNR